MKNTVFTFLFTFLFLSTYATHNRCGYIKAKTSGDMNVEATIITYTNASSLPADRDSLGIDWGDGIFEWIVRDTSYIISEDLQFNSYTWNHSYTTFGNYIISLTDPNRTGGPVNLLLADQYPFHIQTNILVGNFSNETPEIANPPFDVGGIGMSLVSAPNVFDNEGDSLTFELVTPLQGINMEIPNYLFPNEVNSGTNNNFDLNNSTGEISWDAPQLEGRYIITLKVKEYRNDVLISEMIFDCELDIGDPLNIENVISNSLSVYPNPIQDGKLKVELDEKLNLENGIFQIISIDGKVLLEKNINTTSHVQEIDIQRLNKGSYILIFKIEEQIYSHRVIKH